jgi:uncharacterized protein YceK
MKKMMIGLGLMATILGGSGCSTVQCRITHSRPHLRESIYPAVKNDVNMCGYVWSERGSGVFMATLFCAGYGIDVPISCVTDTICLPYDLWLSRKTRRQTEKKDNTEANKASEATSEPAPGAASSSPQG